MKIFETHAHYDDEWFDEDRDELIVKMKENGILTVVNIGCSMDNSKKVLELSKKYDFMYATVGVHPSDIDSLRDSDMEELKSMSQDAKVLGIGEIGLDYHYENIDKALQKHWFEKQLELAIDVSLPVVIHSRDAAKDTLDIIKAKHAGKTGGIIHCFSYGVEMAREYLDMGYYIGVGGVVTFKNAKKLKEVVEYTPLDRIVLETDAPYLAPVPYRGQRNCSLYLPYVAEEISKIKNVSVDEVYEATYQNAINVYSLN